ncbi:murein hydrolase activator EnvC family protein [Sphingomonas sp. RS6]
MALRRGLILLAGLAAIGAGAASGTPAGDTLPDQRRALIDAAARARAAQARSKAMTQAAARERDEAARAVAEESAAAATIAATEADIAAANAHIAMLDAMLDRQRRALFERQSPVLRLVAALQAMARRPALLAIAQPGSMRDMVHVRAMLATIRPAVEARSADARADLDRVRSLRNATAGALASLREAQARLERQRLAALELQAEHRLRASTLQRTAIDESDRALALGETVRAIAAQMTREQDAAQTEATLRALLGPLPRPGSADGRGAAPMPGAYRLPVAGRVITGFGTLSDAGVRARGITLACAPGARVAAPADGVIAYAGRFGDYGGVVIVDHGDGWTSLVSGLAALSVRLGDRVVAGAPIGTAARTPAPQVTVELRRRGRPMDLTQLLD